MGDGDGGGAVLFHESDALIIYYLSNRKDRPRDQPPLVYICHDIAFTASSLYRAIKPIAASFGGGGGGMSTAVASTTTTASPPASASAAAATATVRLAAAVDKSIKTLNKRVLQLISIILDVESSLSPSSTATAPLATSPNNTTTTAADATSTAAVNEKTMLDLKAALVALLVDTQKTFLLLNEHRAWIVQSIDTRIIRGVITSLFELVSQLESSIDDILVNKDNFYPAAAPSPSQPPSHNQQLSDVGLHHPPWNPEKFISTSSTAIRTAKESTFMLKSLIAGLYAGSSAQTPQQHLVSASTTSTPPFDPSSSDTSSSTSLSTIPHLLETQQSITSSSPPSFSSDYDNLRTLLDEMTRSVEAVQASFYDLSNLLAKMGEELAAGDCLPTTIHSSLVVAHVFVKSVIKMNRLARVMWKRQRLSNADRVWNKMLLLLKDIISLSQLIQ